MPYNISISASILSADLGNLDSEIKKINESGCDYIHIDVMDGHFVPNISFGLDLIRFIKSRTNIPLDIHLMISNPDETYHRYIKAGADILTFHLEASENPENLIRSIQSHNIKAGISIRPSSNPSLLLNFLDIVDLILMMSVEPGFSGQNFIEDSLKKLEYISQFMRIKNMNHKILSIDGGINIETGARAIKAGANMLVSGTFLFRNADFRKAVLDLKSNA